MTRLIRGSVLLAACVGLWSCGTDSTSSEAGVPYKISSLPSVVFIKTDSSQLISFQLVDELDGQIPATWTITSSSPNFTVALDSSYRPVYNSDGTLTLPDSQVLVRATITGVALGGSTFTVSAGGKTLDIPVNVVPGTLYATFSPANPAPGAVVTMTMPPTLRLTPASAITFPGNVNPVAYTMAADSMSATFISAPTTDTMATVTNVYNIEYPTITPVTLRSQTKVTGTQSGTWNGKLPAVLSPLVAGSMTATLNPAYAYKCDPTCANALPSVFTFPTQTAPIVAGVSADSTVVTLNVGPNVASPLQVTRVTFKGAPQFEYTLVSEDSVTSAVISSFGARLDQLQSANCLARCSDRRTPGSPSARPPRCRGRWSGPRSWLSRTGTAITVLTDPGLGGQPRSAMTGVISATAPAFQLTAIPAVLPNPLVMQGTVGFTLPGTDDPNTAPLVDLLSSRYGHHGRPDVGWRSSVTRAAGIRSTSQRPGRASVTAHVGQHHGPRALLL